MSSAPRQSDALRHACSHCGLPVPVSRQSEGTREFCCYGCRLADALAQSGPDAPREAPLALSGVGQGTLLLRLGLGVFLAINIMVFSGFFYSQLIYQRDPSRASHAQSVLADFFAYLLMLLTTLVIVLLGVPLARDVFARFSLSANTLILVGVVSAYGLSIYNTIAGDVYALYYDTAAMILVLVTLGSFLDSRAKLSATSAIESFFATLPARAFVQRGDECEEVDAASVKVEQVVRVRPGELIPVDGEVVRGAGSVNEAALTGESTPRDVAKGDRVLAGAINVIGLIHVRASAVGDDRVAARMRALLEQARLLQPNVQRLADRIAAVFVPGVVLLALIVFAVAVLRDRALAGMFDALAVLLISCPCALGLSAPLASWSALSRAAERGVLFSSGLTLERAAGVTHLFFDKTGTLTADKLQVDSIELAPAAEQGGMTIERTLALAAGIEETSLHPIALAVTHEARRRGILFSQVEQAETMPGVGVRAKIAGEDFFLGGARMLGELGIDASHADSSLVQLFLVHRANVIATFKLTEQIRPDAAEAISQLRASGVQVEVLTGDRPGPAASLARTLSVKVHDSLLPAEKLAFLERSRAALPKHARIAMVGDGLNDAPTLAAADVGIVIGNATDLARHSANIHILGTHLTRIPFAILAARHAMRRIRFNLAWSFGYNVIGLALAACGALSPLFAASAMIVSSLMVVASARNAGRVALNEPKATLPPDATVIDDHELRAVLK